MSKPVLNSDGYDQNSPINFVSNLRGKYLLVHGTADDNVHVQNTYEMVSAWLMKIKNLNCLYILIKIMVYMAETLDFTCTIKSQISY